ncbi:hypothetical protein RHGRI_034590 [Rhododendron griersonianum]|uniref:Uncharacterized protein n=1 Tax=Rhododendron griersonianum TaxID=479676 RepID=A0AAV6I531_9ERIC|nr:hypothetical protein RHGRI_034590 [Rhododendron griersonianum]
MSVHSPCKATPSSASSLRKEQSQVELEIKLLEALAIYPPAKLQGKFRKFEPTFASFSLYTPSLCPLWSNGIPAKKVWSISFSLILFFGRHFSSSDVLQLLDRFYNLEMLKPDDEDVEILNQEEDFCLPPSYFVKEES